MPPKSKPILPSFASILDEKLPPSRRSFWAVGVCHSSVAVHHCVICSGFDQYSHTFSTGASILARTVSTVLVCVSIVIFCLVIDDTNFCNPCEIKRYKNDYLRSYCDQNKTLLNVNGKPSSATY